MITVVCLTCNAPRLAGACLQSLLGCMPAFAQAGGAEFVLVDDHSDPDRATLPLLQDFRAAAAPAGKVTIIRFPRRMQYAHGLAYALSLTRGDHVLFISQDMLLAPDCALELLAVAERDPRIGVVRPTSEHMDWAKGFVQSPPVPPTTLSDVATFASQIRRQFVNEAVDWPMLIGDAMLIRRSVIDRIGVFDTRFYAYFADIDYGVRLHRAGFRHVIARGAWLHHEGAGTARETAATGGESFSQYTRRTLEEVETAYEQFRAKWAGATLPQSFRDMRREHFERLHALPPMPADQYQPPLQLSPDIGEIL